MYESRRRIAVVFLTVCAKDHRPILANHKTHTAVRQSWQQARSWRVGQYTVMPDHIHAMVAFAGPHSLDLWVPYWKSLVCRALGVRDLWLRNFWDTRMRSSDHYAEKIGYMLQNPVAAGLVEKPEDWPWQGEICQFNWFGYFKPLE